MARPRIAPSAVFTILLTLTAAAAAGFGPPDGCSSYFGGVAASTEGCSGTTSPYYVSPPDDFDLYAPDAQAVQQLAKELDYDVSGCPSNICKWYTGCPIQTTCRDSEATTGPTVNTSRIIRLFVGVLEDNNQDFPSTGTFTGDYLSALDQMDTFELGGAKGSLPSSWARAWSNVTIIRITGMSGEIPSSWLASGAFPQLFELKLVNGTLSGTLPAALGEDPDVLPQLYNLYLQNNALSGPLPPSIGASSKALPYLQQLDLSNNSFEGTLPPRWGSAVLPYLYTANLGSNNLTGSLPLAWGDRSAFGSIITLDLSSNNLTGTLPDNWAGGFFNPDNPNAFLSHDVTINLSNNDLHGSIPAEWEHIATFNQTLAPTYEPNQPLSDFNVALLPGNSICGSIPDNVIVTSYVTDGTVEGLPPC